MPEPHYLFADLETTGLDAERDAVTEIAWIFESAGHTFEQHYHIKFTGFPSIWSARNTSVGSRRRDWDITPNQSFQTYVSPEFAFGKFFEDCLMLGKDDARVYLVGAVPAFDDRFFRKVFREVPYHYQTIDVETLVMGAYRLAVPPHLKEMRALIGLTGENEHPHDALWDAREVKQIFDALYASKEMSV